EIFLKIEEIIDDVISKKKHNKELKSNIEPPMSEFDRHAPDAKEKESPEGERERQPDQLSEARKTFFQALKELKDNLAGEKSDMSLQMDEKSQMKTTGQQNEGGQED